MSRGLKCSVTSRNCLLVELILKIHIASYSTSILPLHVGHVDMWCLKGREGVCVYIKPNGTKSFGKSLSNVKLEGDPTISRLHAVICVEPADDDESGASHKCLISDLSKYGTFVVRDGRKRKLLLNEKFPLRTGDTVQFGLKDTTFAVSCYSFVIAKSSLDDNVTNNLMSLVRPMGGKLRETWDNSCTYLTVSDSILFTTKVACALASAKPIVTIAYWEATCRAVQESQRLPDIENFLPAIKEEWLKVSSRLLLPNEKRQSLFKGLSFVHFCAKQYFTYLPLITAAGGKSCVYPTKRPLTPRDLTAKNAIVVQQPAESSQFTQVIAADYPVIYRKLQAVKRRMISDTEIPLAILYCSLDTYCNSKFEFATFLKSRTQTSTSSDFVIIEETQENDKAVNEGRIKRNVIPETCASLSDNNENGDLKTDVPTASSTDGSNNATKITRNVDRSKVTCNIIPETCESQENERVVRNIFSPSKKKQRAGKVDTFSRKLDKQFTIIPESCSLEESANDTVSGKIDREQARVVSESSGLNERAQNVVKNLVARKVQRQTVESPRKRSIFTVEKEDDRAAEKDTLASGATSKQQRENDLIPEKGILHCTERNSSQGTDDSSDDEYGKSDRASWQSSRENLKRPRIVSIEEIDNCGINIGIARQNAKEETSSSLKERKAGCSRHQEKNERGKKESRTRERDKKRDEKPRKPATNWYSNREPTDEILRKDAPRGKNFTKMPVVLPKRILRMDDFVLTKTT